MEKLQKIKERINEQQEKEEEPTIEEMFEEDNSYQDDFWDMINKNKAKEKDDDMEM